ncbi:MAG: hypothetical protein RSB90_10955 [Eubacterium sp.]
MINIQDYPITRNLEQTGWPDAKEPQYPDCPMCGSQAEEFYKNKEGEIIGCSDCVEQLSWEYVDAEGRM